MKQPDNEGHEEVWPLASCQKVVARGAVWRYPLEGPGDTGDASASYNRGPSFNG